MYLGSVMDVMYGKMSHLSTHSSILSFCLFYYANDNAEHSWIQENSHNLFHDFYHKNMRPFISVMDVTLNRQASIGYYIISIQCVVYRETSTKISFIPSRTPETTQK